MADAFIGGWSVQAIGQMQSGRPISFHDRNIYFNGDLESLKTDYSGDTNLPVFDISGFYFSDLATPALQRADQRIRLANNIRYFPSRGARPAWAGPESVGHLVRQAAAIHRPRPRTVPPRSC